MCSVCMTQLLCAGLYVPFVARSGGAVTSYRSALFGRGIVKCHICAQTVIRSSLAQSERVERCGRSSTHCMSAFTTEQGLLIFNLTV